MEIVLFQRDRESILNLAFLPASSFLSIVTETIIFISVSTILVSFVSVIKFFLLLHLFSFYILMIVIRFFLIAVVFISIRRQGVYL